jgi:glycosyltransferase involved in cell wall biosynthesis
MKNSAGRAEMRLMYVIQELRAGGAERIVVSLARGAQEAGHEVAVAAAPGPLAAEFGTRAFSLPLLKLRPWLVPQGALRLRAALRTWPADLIHCHNPGMAALTSLATLRGRRPPALVSVHGVPEEDYPTAARALRLAGLPTVACGPGVESALRESRYPVRATIPNGISPPPPPADRAQLEDAWGIASGQQLVVCAGRLAPPKNHALAIEAIADVPDAVLLVVGEGRLRAELERKAKEAGVADRVVFAGERPDARAIIGAADVVVLPSRSEGLPLVALEALAAGTPLVATAIRGIAELIHDGESGLLVPPDDAPALAGALKRALSEPELITRLAEGGRRVAAEHTEERMVSQFLELYDELIATSGGDGR